MLGTQWKHNQATRAELRQPERPASVATTAPAAEVNAQLTRHVLRLTWCISPMLFPAAVVVHLMSGLPFNAGAARYLAAIGFSGLALTAIARVALRNCHPALLTAYTALVCLNVGIFAAHPNIFGAQNTVAGAAVQVNTMLVAMILQSMLMCGRRTVSAAIIAGYLAVAFVGPVHPDLPLSARIAAVAMVGGALGIAVSVLHRVLRSSLELSHSNARLVEELRTANAQLSEFARMDALTGVLNRRGWVDATATAAASSKRVTGGRGSIGRAAGIVYVDIDGFKQINDSHGHAAGDIVLQDLAAALTDALRPGDVVARIGGDEFAALFTADSADEVRTVENRLDSALVNAGIAGQVRWSASVGSAFVEHAGDLHSAALRADSELYRRKTNRKGHPAPR